jgi:D-apiose dehydrogenase
MSPIRIAVVGCGYFSHFHFDAWSRIDGVDVVACCDTDVGRGNSASMQYNIPQVFTDHRVMLDACEVDAVDIVTGPQSHLAIVSDVAARGASIICQKPLASTLGQAKAIVETAARARVRLMVHDNFRFQPWYREIRKLLDAKVIGGRLHTIAHRIRTGDGHGSDAYLGRQPYFRDMPRFLIDEAGVHTVDTMRYLAGEVKRVWCMTRKLNPVIAGEDAAIAVLDFVGGGLGHYDANRFNESLTENARYTFGEMTVETDKGTIRLYDDGRLTIQPLGRAERDHAYQPSTLGFAGDSVRATQQHFVDGLREKKPLETEGDAYLRTLAIVEAMYRSAESGQWEVPIVNERVNRWG